MKKIIVVLGLFISLQGMNQTFQSQQRGLAVYNTLFGGIVGGIGNCINNKQEKKIHKRFIKGFWMGSVGGIINYTGKRLTYNVSTAKYNYTWLSNIVHSTGSSIIENAIMNKKIYQHFSMDFGFIRFDADFIEKKYLTRVQPFGLCSFVAFCAIYDLKIGKSLLYGTPYFEHDNMSLSEGYELFGNIVIKKRGYDKYIVENHEILHSFQGREYLSFNLYLNTQKYKLNKFISIDIPFGSIAYYTELYLNKNKSSFYEMEVNSISENRYHSLAN